MALIGIQNLSITFGDPPLLNSVSLQLEEGDRVCLLGRNGAGKSTFLKVLAGQIEPDEGEIVRAGGKSGGVTTAYLGQEFPDRFSGTALEVAAGLGRDVPPEPERILAAEQTLTMLGMDHQQSVATMSGGEKRRVLLSRVLSSGADVLLLDEPTNHLDIDTVIQLEDYLLRRIKTFVYVTHDRAFARRLANRVAEIDRGDLYVFQSGYDRFIEQRDDLLEAEAKKRKEFDKKLSEEEAWLRRGVKARRTRNEGRVKALLKMREDYRQRRERTGSASMEIHQGQRSGDLVIETKGVAFAYAANQPIVRNLTTTVMRSDRLGIVGPNGVGKTTLIKLLLQELDPQQGSVRHGVNLQPLYLDQMRDKLDESKSVAENITDGSDTVTINGRSKHIFGYLQDFLFAPERAKNPITYLSGGERNRLLLAKLFAKPSNLLILDEPTNDLDLDTLELLEELLQEYPGTILLVSHDREFLDNVVTDCLVLTGDGRVIEYAGGYSDWHNSELRRQTIAGAGGNNQDAAEKQKTNKPKSRGPRKLSFREKQELEQLPDTIHAMEQEKERIHAQLADPDLYRDQSRDPAAVTARLDQLELELDKAYQSWERLEQISTTVGMD